MTAGERSDERPPKEVSDVARNSYGVSIGDAALGIRGEQSIGWRGTSPAGDRFVQLFPTWRTVEELVWCDAVASAAATVAPTCVHALPSGRDELVTVTSEGRVMVFPFVEGSHPRSMDVHAAEVLAAIHRGIAAAWDRSRGPRPGRAVWSADRLDVMPDAELDAWERSLAGRAWLPIHGDFYGGNLLVSDDRVVGVVDWSEASIEAMEQEVSWALWEFCQDDAGEDLVEDAVEPFLDAYLRGGGPASVARPFDPLPWIRRRLRWESRSWYSDPRSEAETDAYYEAQAVAFTRLRGRRLLGR